MPAPIGNKYAAGCETSGRPPAFETPVLMQAAIEDYFKDTEKKYTISGLAYHLGFESRQSFYDYEKKEEFTYTVKRARLRIEMQYEEKLSDGQCTGSIFALKNMGWSDRQEVDVNIRKQIEEEYADKPEQMIEDAKKILQLTEGNLN